MPTDDKFEIQCPKCTRRLRAPVEFAGRRVKCPQCGQPVKLPDVPVKPAALAPPAIQAVASSKPSEAKTVSAPLPSLADAGEDWLNLGGPAIADLAERQHVVEQARAEKDRQRQLRENRNRQRAAHPAGEVNEVAFGKQAPLPTILARAESQTPKEPAAQKRSIFDDDLPDLAELQPAPADSASKADRMLAEHAGLSLDELGKLPGESLPPRDNRRKAIRPLPAKPSPAPLAFDGDSDNLESQTKSTVPSLYDEAPKQTSKPKKVDPEYRITCTACGTAQYVKLSNKGMKIKCPDCYSQFRVPGPPANWQANKKPKPQQTLQDMPLAAEEELKHAEKLESQRARTSKMLEKARKEISDEELDQLYSGDFDTAGFVRGTFGFLSDPFAVAQLIGYGLVFGLLFAVAHFANDARDTVMGKGILLGVFLGGPVIGLLFAMPMFSNGIAILEAAANRQTKVSHWPGFNLFDNLGDAIAITMAVVGSMVPGFLIGFLIGGEAEGAGRIQIAGMMLTCSAFLPIFLLSMLDNGSVFAPLSTSVMRSISGSPEAWGAYFLKTMIAFGLVVLFWLLMLGKNPIMSAIAGAMLPLLAFFVCQQLGTLASHIEEHLNIEFDSSETGEQPQTESKA